MKKLVLSMLFLAVAVTVSLSQNVYADFEDELKDLQNRLAKLENKSSDTNGGIFDGLSIGGGITLVLQNLQNANTAPEGETEFKTPTLGSYSIDLEIEKKFDDNNTAFLHLETGHGDINDYLDAIAGVNRDADASENVVQVTEAWFEHKFTDNFAMSVGILDPTTALDDNAYANDETSQFLGSMFRNAANIGFSDNAFGVKATYETDVADFAIQYVDASEYKEITRNGFASAQVNFKPNFIDDMEGNYRVYGWTNTNDYTKIKDAETTDAKDYGFGISLDQQLSDIFGAFARYGWSRGDVGVDNDGALETTGIAHTWSVGLQATVNGIGEEDVVAIAYGQIIPSDDYKDNINKDAKSENHLEVYYSWNVNDYLAISPNFQMVENPFYNENDDTAYVGSIRMQISF